jgi:hypothetical protein
MDGTKLVSIKTISRDETLFKKFYTKKGYVIGTRMQFL